MNIASPLIAIALALGTLGGPVLPVAAMVDSEVSDRGPLDLPLQQVSIEMPAPGESVLTELSVSNVSGRSIPLSVAVPELGGPATQGTTPVELRVLGDSGAELLSTSELTAGSGAFVGELPAGGTSTVILEAALPLAAENEYQAKDARAVVQFTATEPDRPGVTPPHTSTPNLIQRLAETGAALSIAAVLALGGITAGILLTARARRKNHAS
ncbi:hypothetical protein [Leucobacter luti]|uniref:hypothetical protein n=1 Tax=Leucobacter luti TaxID=340320 RepID=UPI001C69076F|nr:hypothetical protein [Leucobacter luti]QYM76315.1 hypothetical protein K1X41_02270 [Leucobacter luti]